MNLVDLLQMSDGILDTEDEEKDPTFDLDESIKHDTNPYYVKTVPCIWTEMTVCHLPCFLVSSLLR